MSAPRRPQPSTIPEKKRAPSNWLQKEKQDDVIMTREILQIFWDKILLNQQQLDEKTQQTNRVAVDNFKKHIAYRLYPKDESQQNKVFKIFDEAQKEAIKFDTFCDAIQKYGMNLIYDMNKAEHLVSIKIVDSPRLIDNQDIRDLQTYIQDSKMSVAISLSTGKEKILTPDFKENQSKSLFPILSVAKIFTGMLVMQMIRHNIIKEEDLHKHIQLSASVLKKLPTKIRKHLKKHKVTLHQAMTHMAGIGDYVDKYSEAIQSGLLTGNIPRMNRIIDFLQFADDRASPVGEFRYSNLGFLLVGLAIEHAYANHINAACEYNKDILWPYLILDENGQSRYPSFCISTDHPTVHPDDEILGHYYGSPAGGYWCTVEDLAKFGKWIYDQCSNDPELRRLVEQYGQEFYHAKDQMIAHDGNMPMSSARLSVSLKTGTVIATVSNQSGSAIRLEQSARKYLFATVPENKIQPSVLSKSSSTLFNKNNKTAKERDFFEVDQPPPVNKRRHSI